MSQGAVAAWTYGQEEVGGAGDGGDAGINDDDFATVVACLPDIVGEDGEALGDIRAGENQRLGLRDVLPWVGTTIDAKGHLVRGPGAHHAEPTVVIDVLRAQRNAGELAVEI